MMLILQPVVCLTLSLYSLILPPTAPNIMLFGLLILLLTLSIPFTAFASSAAGQETLIGLVGKDFVMLGADSSVSQSIALSSTKMDKIYVIRDIFPRSHVARKRPNSTPSAQTILAAAAGNAADIDRMIGMLQSQTTIQEYESCIGNDVEYVTINGDEYDVPSSHIEQHLSVEAVARLARGQIASSLRTNTPYQVCLLVAGMQQEDNGEEEDLITSCHSSHLQQQVQRASSDFSKTTTTTTKSNTADGDAASDTLQQHDALKPKLYWLDSYGALQKLQYGAHGLGANFLWSILDQGFRPDLTREEALHLFQECFRQLRLRYVINSPQTPCIKCVDANGCHVIQK